MIHSYLCVTGTKDKQNNILKKVLFIKDFEAQKLLKKKKSQFYKLSPIFPVFPSHAKIPPLKSECKICLFFPYNAFQSIGKIINEIEPESQKFIYFSLGLASIVVFDTNGSLLDDVWKLIGTESSGYEIWPVKKNILLENDVEYKISHPIKLDLDNFKIEYSELADHELIYLLDEFSLCIRKIISLSSIYFPPILFSLKRIIIVAQEIIDEILFLTKYRDGVSKRDIKEISTLPIKSIFELDRNSNQVQERIYQRIGAVNEIVGVLSHVLSQLYSGTSPILENGFRITNYSLLGVGTAYKALCSFTQFIEKKFQNFPITKVIKNYFKNQDPIPNAIDLFNYNLDDIKSYNFNIDNYFEDLKKDPIKSSLVYFSLRLGFKESSHTISAARQVIPFADSVAWSLLTLSHELLHAHVRSIFGAIFKDEKNRSPEKWFNELCLEYISKYHSEQNQIDDSSNDSLLNSIKMAILEYCMYREEYSSLSIYGLESDNHENGEVGKVQYGITKPNPDTILERLRSYYKDINEIFVHVLDYHYFYDCQTDLYIGLLWESWSTVPSVFQNVNVYVLRTLIAIGTEIEVDSSERFKETVKIVKEELEKIRDFSQNKLTIEKAIECIENEDSLKTLENLFDITIFLADIVNKFLCSENIYSSMVVDSDKGPDSNIFYGIDTGIFEDTPIQSPVAFLHDRLKTALKLEESEFDLEYRSAWLLHACASSASFDDD